MASHVPTRTDFGPRRLLDVPAVAELTGIPHRTVRRMFDERRVPLTTVGRRVFVWSTDLADYLDANARPARTEAVAR